MTNAEGRVLVSSYFPEFTTHQLAQLEAYAELLIETNQSINLISRKNEDEVWVNHILHSLSIAKVLQPKADARFLDFGTGGGLPGIPLAIVFPQCHFHLVDSINKKITAVQRMVDEIGLNNVHTDHDRVENLTGHYHYAVSRAVTALPKIQTWLRGKLLHGSEGNLANGLIYIKGGDFSEELRTINRKFQEWHIPNFFQEPFFETKKVVWVDLTR